MGVANPEPEQPQTMRAHPCVPCRLMPRKRLSPQRAGALRGFGVNRSGEAQEPTA